MAIYMWREWNWWEEITDNITSAGTNTSYFYWVAFTPNTNCSLICVKFLGTTFTWWWILRIAQWNYASATWTQYNISGSDIVSWKYTLPSSFSLIANTRYVVSFKESASWEFGLNNTISYPIQWNVLTFEYWTHSNSNTKITNYIYNISALQTQ